ncbi:MAG: glycosyltransferase [Planctomycetes bacterium]|nr:glycosyltransferase [Planctomycetota bacterium]
MAAWEKVVLIAYYSVLVILSIYGMHRYVLVYLYYRYRDRGQKPQSRFTVLPSVTVQLPIFNEATVVERLVDAVCAIDYPRDRLEIQVLDDSTDETVEIARKKVRQMAERGHRIRHLRRSDRSGFKAGALASGLGQSDSELVAIFDADFVPEPDILRRTVDHFTDPRVGMVQTRWGHINRRFSLLTLLQSILLDGHFVIEHAARNRSGRFFNFNGTAGIWRRACIAEAGGWEHDTLTEDLDLSYRAQLKGWRFVFLPDVVSPGELPVEMNSFKTQQHRWAKGSIQVCRKLLPTIWRSSAPLKAKVEATFHLTANFAYVLMIVMALLMLPALLARISDQSAARGILFDVSLFMAATTSMLAFYTASQREAYSDWKSTIKYFPLLIALGIGISLNNTKAVIEALFRHETPFVRTPKYNVAERLPLQGVFRYFGARQHFCFLEIALGLYFALTTSVALAHGLLVTSFFLLLFTTGYSWVGIASSLRPRRRPVAATVQQAA